jgi:aminopeptidase N
MSQTNRSLVNNMRSDTIDVTIYKLYLDVSDFNTNIIKASCQVNFTAKMNNVSGISLDLLSLQVDSVKFQGQLTTYTYNDTLLRVNFPTILNENQSDSVTVYYQGTPVTDASGWGGFYFQNGVAYNLGVGFAADPHNYGRVWHPCFDNFVERAQYEMKIRTTGTKRAYASGIITDEDNSIPGEMTRTWKISDPIPTYLACFAVGDYVHVTQTYTSPTYGYTKPVMLVARAQDTTGMKNSFTNLFNMMDVFEQRYGPYLWEKIGYVLVPFNSGAMEHATLVAYPQSVGAGNTTFGDLISHELSHHWWGNLVTCSTSSEMWINEGFAVYSEAIYRELATSYSSYINHLKNKHLAVLQGAHFNDGGFYPLSGVPHGAVYGDHSYDKGAVMLHNMRTYLGDSLFFTGLQAIQQDFAFQSVSGAQVRDKLTEVTGVDMTDFFEDWIYQPGFVGVVLEQYSVVPNGSNFTVTVSMRQKIREADHLFSSIPLQVNFVEEIGDETYENIVFSGEQLTITFTLPFAPKMVYLNGNDGILNAVTAKNYLLTENGTQLDSYSYSRVISPSANGSGTRLVRMEHCRVAPNDWIDQNLGIQVSSQRYWRVDGVWEDGYSFNTWFVFDGRNSFSGNLDMDLMTNPNGLPFHEDSLRLLYRPNATSPWTIVSNAELNKQGSSTDCSGRFVLNNVQKGEYTFGVKYSALSLQENQTQQFLLYPNPSQNQVTFVAPSEGAGTYVLRFVDVQGRVVSEESAVHNDVFTLDIKPGVYLVNLIQNGKVISSMRMVIQ